MRFIAAGCSVIGPAHRSQKLPNQDSIVLRGARGGWVAAACDGLGSCRFSQHGSRMAGRAVLDQTPLVGGEKPAAINSAIHQRWLNLIQPYAVRDVATTCLWAALDRQGNCKLSQLGDGLVLFKSGGRFYRLTPERQGFGNQTQALWLEHKANHWQEAECHLSAPGDGVVLMTDGVSDDLVPDSLSGFFDALYQGVTSRGRRLGRQWLKAELESWSTPLHGDDKSVVAIFRTE